MELTLPDDLAEFVEEKVRSGQFASAADVVRGALSVLRAEERLTPQDVEELRAELRVGLEQLDRGAGGPWDAEVTKARLRERAARSAKAS